jgi:thiol-disulfide isomerase/thioredoxin
MLEKLSVVKSKKFVIIIILIAVFIGAAIFVYNKYVAPKLNPKFVENREFTSNDMKDSTTNATIFFIYATWCPHSKKVIKHWEKLKNKYDYKIIKRPVNPETNVTLTFIEYDGDKQENEIEEFSKLYNKKIEGYPTIILVKDNEVIEFEAEPTPENLNEFVRTTL